MAGTRGAPDVTTTATYKLVSIHWVDDSDDIWSESYTVPVATTQAAIEALADALQLASGASIYWIEVSSGWGSRASRNKANAEGAGTKSPSVFDAVNLTHKNGNPLIKNQIVRIPAPIAELFVLDAEDVPQDIVDGASTELAAVQTASEAVLGAGYQAVYARFSEKTEITFPTTSLTALS